MSASGRDFIINQFARVRDDSCDVEQRIRDSSGPGAYQVTNLVPKEKEVKRLEIPNPTLLGREGYGYNNRAIDDDSRLRTDPTLEGRFRAPLHMQSRPFATVPYMGRGRGQPDIESGLIYADWARIKRPCGTVSETFFSNQFVPLVPHLSSHIQNPSNLIPEVAARGFCRSGIPTRQFVRDLNM